MNDSIQNLHYKIKKEVSVEIVRENLIEWRYPGILTVYRRARAFRLHQESESRSVKILQLKYAVYEFSTDEIRKAFYG